MSRPGSLNVSDGCLLRILEGLMTLKLRGAERERLSYRTLDVEQIGSVYETVMGFTVEAASGRVLAIKAGKNNHTPVFVSLEELLAKKGKDRIKDLKENAGRGQLSAAQAKAVEAATSVDEIAAALDSIIDERGSPRHAMAPPDSPILQPTDERRRTGSHYTPRSLTAPIVKHALEPAFERLGPDATPDQVLDLKVCDPAMGSGAFLVEACRTIGERLVKAWERWPETRPKIPADEDEELHARRLVAQRCLYGVDKNPRAVDLARLSLWLATLAKDHEFTFLDHALKMRRQPRGPDYAADRGGKLGRVQAGPAAIPAAGEGHGRGSDDGPRRNPGCSGRHTARRSGGAAPHYRGSPDASPHHRRCGNFRLLCCRQAQGARERASED